MQLGCGLVVTAGRRDEPERGERRRDAFDRTRRLVDLERLPVDRLGLVETTLAIRGVTRSAERLRDRTRVGALAGALETDLVPSGGVVEPVLQRGEVSQARLASVDALKVWAPNATIAS